MSENATETSTTADTDAEQTTTETTETEAPENDDARVTRANREAAKYRTDLRAAQQALDEQGKTLAALAAVFNPGGDPEADPAKQLADITGKAENLQTRVGELEAELLVHTLAAETAANPVALLDSRGFTTKLHGLDPAADDYRDQVAKAITDAVAHNKNLAAAGQVPSRGGAPGAGQGSEQPAGAVTQEQFDAMSYKERSELFRTNPELYRRLAG